MDREAQVARAVSKQLKKESVSKKKSKRASLPEGAETPASKKKKVSARTIAYDQKTQLAVLRKNMGCFEIFCPVSGYSGLYSSLTQEPMFGIAFPLLLDAPLNKGKLQFGSHATICGTSRPELIFSVINRSFAELFPEEEAQRIADWEVFKWNLAYYGAGIKNRAPQWKDVASKLEQLRSFGGDKNPTHVNVIGELGTAKSDFALDLKTLFAKRGVNERPGNVPLHAAPMGRESFTELKLKIEERRVEEENVGLLVDSDKLEKHVSAREEESSDEEEESSCSESEEQ